MKKIERVTYESLFYGDDKIACAIAALSNKINELVDAHNELLETHKHKLKSVGLGAPSRCDCGFSMSDIIQEFLETETVKEPCDHKRKVLHGEGGEYWICRQCGYTPSNSEKEECPTCREPKWCCAFMKGDDGYCDSCRPKEEVKEECRCRSGELKTGGKWASWSKDNCPVHPDKSPFDKEEPTTP